MVKLIEESKTRTISFAHSVAATMQNICYKKTYTIQTEIFIIIIIEVFKTRTISFAHSVAAAMQNIWYKKTYTARRYTYRNLYYGQRSSLTKVIILTCTKMTYKLIL